jgi:hypothetical protein
MDMLAVEARVSLKAGWQLHSSPEGAAALLLNIKWFRCFT